MEPTWFLKNWWWWRWSLIYDNGGSLVTKSLFDMAMFGEWFSRMWSGERFHPLPSFDEFVELMIIWTRGAPSSVSRNRLAAGPIRMHFKRFQSRTFELFRMGGEYHCVTNDGVSHWWLFCFWYILNLHVSHQCSFRLSWILNVDTTQISTSTYKLQMIISLIFMEQFFSCHSLKPGVTQIWGKKD